MAIHFYSDIHLNANKLGRDADNLLDFSTDNQITFRVGAGDGVVFKASGEIEATKFDGALEGNADTATTAGTVTTAAQPEITTLVGVTSLGVASATTNILAGDLTMYNAVNDGNPTISLGSSATNRFEIKTDYNSGAQTVDQVYFSTYTTSSTANDGRYIFEVDEVELGRILDGGLSMIGFGLFADYIQQKNTTASSATEGGKLILMADDGAAMGDDHRLGVIEFSGAEDASNNRQTGASIQAMCDAAWSASENGTRLEFYTMDLLGILLVAENFHPQLATLLVLSQVET